MIKRDEHERALNWSPKETVEERPLNPVKMAFQINDVSEFCSGVKISVRARLERLGQRELATEGLRSRAVKINPEEISLRRRLARSIAERNQNTLSLSLRVLPPCPH